MEDISIMLLVRGKESAKEKVSYFALLCKFTDYSVWLVAIMVIP